MDPRIETAAQRRQQKGNAPKLLLLLLLVSTGFLTMTSSASALTLGVGWASPGYTEPEMPIVAKSGAETFRIPFGGGSESLVETAARNGITIHPEVRVGDGNASLPFGTARDEFIDSVSKTVTKYGYEGTYWKSHQDVPYKPIKTWEVWNEPNLHGIGAGEFGVLVGEVANAIQKASEAQASGKRTEVLSGGLYAQGNGESYKGALTYLTEAYSKFKSNEDVTGVAIHPYEHYPSTFLEPKPGVQYNRIQAFEYAVKGFHEKLVELAKDAGKPRKSLWITEAGWAAGGEAATVVSEDTQAKLLRESVEFTKNNQAAFNIKGFIWYNFRDVPNGGTRWDNWCGLRADDKHFRPSWSAFQNMAGVPYYIPEAPGVETRSATEVQGGQAKINGWVHPHGLPTTYYFDYGTSTAYGNSIPNPPASAGAGESGVEVGATISGLQANTTYYYRLVAKNALGTSIAGASSFKTPAVPRRAAYQGAQGELWTTSLPSSASNQHLGMGTAASRPSIAPLSSGSYVAAFRDTGNQLWTYTPGGGGSNLKLAMMPGSMPSIASLPDNGYVIAFQSSAGELWVYSPFIGAQNLHLGMGTTPSNPDIAVLADGSYVITFRAYGNTLFSYESKFGATNLNEAMLPGASPSVTALPNGSWRAAFQSSAGQLTSYSPVDGLTKLSLGMGTEPSTPDIATLNDGNYAIAFRAYGGNLWTYTKQSGGWDTGLGMGTPPAPPSITATPNGSFEVAFKAFGDELWTYSPSAGGASTGLAVKAGSSPGIATLPDGTRRAAYQGAQGELWTTSLPSSASNQHLGMGTAASRPSIATLSGGSYIAAFRDTGNKLWIYTPGGGGTNLNLAMMPGSTPSIAALPNNGYVVAFQANDGKLWIYSSFLGAVPLNQGMGTTASNPDIAVLPDGSYVIAFRAFGNALFSYESKYGATNLNQQMLPGASPSVTALPSGTWRLAFQTSAGELATYSPAFSGVAKLGLGMGTEASTPDIATLADGSWLIAFRAYGGSLYTYGEKSGGTNTNLGMGTPPSTPSITASPNGGYEVAFKAFGDELWTYSPGQGGASTGLAVKAGSSPGIAG